MAGLAAAELSYCCLPAAAALQLHYVCQDTFLCITLNKHSVLPSLHSHPGAAFNPSLVLPHLWDVPMPRFCHLSEDTVLHPPQVLLLWPLFMPASELNKLHSSQKTYCQGGSWHIITPKAAILRSERRKRRRGETNFFCSLRQLEELPSCPEELGTMGVPCHGKPWEVGLRALKLYHHMSLLITAWCPLGADCCQHRGVAA